MNRSEMNLSIIRNLDKIKDMFRNKQSSYGKDDDALYNFREPAKKYLGVDNIENMFKISQIFQEKHLTTLAKNGIMDKEVKERLIDVAVYALIQYSMVEERERLYSNQFDLWVDPPKEDYPVYGVFGKDVNLDIAPFFIKPEK